MMKDDKKTLLKNARTWSTASFPLNFMILYKHTKTWLKRVYFSKPLSKLLVW